WRIWPSSSGKTYAELTVPPGAAKGANLAGNGEIIPVSGGSPSTGRGSSQQNPKFVKGKPSAGRPRFPAHARDARRLTRRGCASESWSDTGGNTPTSPLTRALEETLGSGSLRIERDSTGIH